MSGPRIAAAVLLPAMIGGAVALGLATGTAMDAVFLGVVAAVLFAAGAIAFRSLREAGRAGRAARAVIAAGDDELVARSVAAESARLTRDIDSRLRACLAEVADLARSAEFRELDPGVAAGRIHFVSREATSELRRQLGLLRDADGIGDQRVAASAPDRSDAPRAVDIALAAGTAALAVAEFLIYPLVGETLSWAGVAVSTLAAGTLLWWRRATGPAALACGAIWFGASLTPFPVPGGFWVMVILSLFGFRLAARGSSWIDLAGAAALGAGVVAGSAIADPDNLAAVAAVLVVASATGGIVRLSRTISRRARRAERTRTQAVEPAVRAAVAQRRAALARELHDTVSHAVGVIAVQAAAAEVSWPAHPERARAALAACGETASAALAELVAAASGEIGAAGADELVSRFRSAGLDVRWDAASARFVTSDLEPLVARIVQESLTNVLRHSSRKGVSIEIEPVGAALRVVVEDDGEGERAATPGFGLTGLRERVELAGGRFRAGPGPGGGFLVEVSLPRAGVGA